MTASPDQDTPLPVSSDELLARFASWGLSYRLHEHVPLRTVEDAKSVEDAMQVPGEAAFRVKNLYLRDRKKRNWLVTVEQDRPVDLKALGQALGAPGLSFGSSDRLMEFLGIRPGAVSPLAMITGAPQGVRLVLDAALREANTVYVHPLVNDRTIAISRDDLLSFLDKVGADVTWLDPADD